jgi:hypothetical protein
MSLEYFSNYDYSLMNNPEYKEDTVREEIITPLIKLLGYNVGGENRVIRSRRLEHPFITVGSGSRRINIIPDYILEAKDKIVLVLDAKSPNEIINTGKHVEQVYSYAIHPEIRSKLFALCNGKEFSLFHLNKIEPILYFHLSQIEYNIEKLIRIFHPDFLASSHLLEYYPDFGIYLKRLGGSEDGIYIFMEVYTLSIGKTDEEHYTCSTTHDFENIILAQSIDFHKSFLNEILSNCSDEYKQKIIDALSHAPFQFFGERGKDADIVFGVKTRLGEIVNTPEESFIPFVVEKVLDIRY